MRFFRKPVLVRPSTLWPAFDRKYLSRDRAPRIRQSASEQYHRSTGQPIDRSTDQRGMTLIEILVAISLMGLLAVAMVTALTVGAGAWQDARSHLTLDHRIATANEILYAEFEELVPLAARAAAVPRAAFFQGEPESMRFVSGYSLTAGRRGGLRIVELQVGDTSRGRRILLNELPYGGPAALGGMITGVEADPLSGAPHLLFAPIVPRATSLIIADELEACRFSYLRLPRTRAEPALWVPRWGDLIRLPGAIRVEMTPRQGQARLLPVSITAPVRARFAQGG
jgi:prepilin-type N-terminal cleavage/methylation domain-containing protein